MGDFPGHPFRGNQYTNVQVVVRLTAPNPRALARTQQAKMTADDAQRKLGALGIHLPPDTQIIVTDAVDRNAEMNRNTLGATTLDGKTIYLNVAASTFDRSRDSLMSKYWDHRYEAQKRLYETGMYSSKDIDHVALHEIGHALHAMSSERPDTTPADEQVMRSVSKYAGTSTSEFVAEVFAAGVAGTLKPSAEVRELYERLGGPHPEVVFRGKS